jgi:hypothetical protein
MAFVVVKLKGANQMNKTELLLKAIAKMRRPCSTGVMIDRRVLLLLLRLRGKNKKGLDKSEKK